MEAHTKASEEIIAGGISVLQENSSSAAASMTEEMKQLREEEQLHHKQLTKTFANGFADTSDTVRISCNITKEVLQQLEGQVNAQVANIARNTEEAVSRATAELQASLQAATAEMVSGIEDGKNQGQEQYFGIRSCFDDQMSTQHLHTEKMIQSFYGLQDPMFSDMQKTRRHMNTDFRLVLSEIARMQQALHIDYVVLGTGPGPSHQNFHHQPKPSAFVPVPEPAGQKVLSRRETLGKEGHAALVAQFNETSPQSRPQSGRSALSKKRAGTVPELPSISDDADGAQPPPSSDVVVKATVKESNVLPLTNQQEFTELHQPTNPIVQEASVATEPQLKLPLTPRSDVREREPISPGSRPCSPCPSSPGSRPAIQGQSPLHMSHTQSNPVTPIYDDDDGAINLKDVKRVREFYCQTDKNATKEFGIQTDPTLEKEPKKKRKVGADEIAELLKKDASKKRQNNAFNGVEQLKQKAKAASIRAPYNVADFYWDTGWAQMVARSNIFDTVTLVVVIVNAVWIAIDTDMNDAVLITNAKAEFQIVENLFCTYFTGELLIRFLAMKVKMHSLKDGWFVFDLSLVALMVMETWMVPVIFFAANINATESGNLGSMTLLKMVRLVKMLRLSRMAKFLRQVPELVIIMKGLLFAARSVFVFFLLWGMIVYVFAVLFRQVTDDSKVGKEYFSSVPAAMNTLLLNGVFVDHAVMVNDMAEESAILWPVIVFFIALVSLTIMYMLVGVLVDVVTVVASSEKEALAISDIASQLRFELEHMGYDDKAVDSLKLSLAEFQKIMVDPAILKLMQNEGVDVVVLVDMLDLIFEDFAHKGNNDGCLCFSDLVDVILNMKGTNPATVKDCKQQLRVTKSLITKHMEDLAQQVQKELWAMRTQMASDREFDLNADRSDEDEDL
eukprot:TRINITY_DN14280_c0_g3_i1.p1 TRINITY_DN14280_c0_g3~~TRINITY_DN14280_c0_g3_i1.p1  ORF type:complete len:996 (-),score=163.78 TRINITY_DN14280_c0_g3_i1:118-2823(-)